MVRVYLFACGHGDTILLNFPENRWALVDCYLPKHDGTRARFFDFLRTERIDRLEWIFQTHPDVDHFHGMVEVLDYFTSNGRSIGLWCDGGLNAKDIRTLLWPDRLTRDQYAKLQERLDQLDEQDLIEFAELNERTEAFSPRGYSKRIRLVPVGPTARTKRRTGRKDIPKLADDRDVKLETNALSVILALSMQDGPRVANLLLAGDAGVTELDPSLDIWKDRAKHANHKWRFDVVKVPHHGSLKSHSRRLCKSRRKDQAETLAAISVGSRRVLPDREVLRDYLDKGWQVMLTTVQVPTVSVDLPMMLSDRSDSPNCLVDSHTIQVSWRSNDGLSFQPAEASVEVKDLEQYETARS